MLVILKASANVKNLSTNEVNCGEECLGLGVPLTTISMSFGNLSVTLIITPYYIQTAVNTVDQPNAQGRPCMGGMAWVRKKDKCWSGRK